MSSPKVSIGLAVYNGENFVRQAIDSILGQTFSDLELVISDNASTDQTENICRGYAANDQRVRYYRNPENVGAVGNSNRVFDLARGQYFKWAAHDDVLESEFLSRCVEVLDHDPGVVLCYARAISIDPQGIRGKHWGARPAFNSELPLERFKETFAPTETFPIWGLMRSEVLKKTPLFGYYPECDLTLLSELSLHGRFYEIPEFLFLSREHQGRSVRAYDFRNPYKAIEWYNPKRAGKVFFPAWSLLWGHLAGIHRSPVLEGRWSCYKRVLEWAYGHREDLWRDLEIAGQHLPAIGPVVGMLRHKRLATSWNRQVRQIVQKVEAVVPPGQGLIVVDDDAIGIGQFSKWQAIPFLEQGGEYWGVPPDDQTAIEELERLRQTGVSFMVITWPCFWWLDYYGGWKEYVFSKFTCLKNDAQVLIFRL